MNHIGKTTGRKRLFDSACPLDNQGIVASGLIITDIKILSLCKIWKDDKHSTGELRFTDFEGRLVCKWWVALDGLICSSWRLVRHSPSAFLPIRDSLARLFKSGAGTASFRLLRLLLLLLSFTLSFVRKSSHRDLMEFWTLLFRAHNPPASFIFHSTRLLEIVSNADYCAQHLSGWESVSWWTAVLQFWRSLKEMEIGLNSL